MSWWHRTDNLHRCDRHDRRSADDSRSDRERDRPARRPDPFARRWWEGGLLDTAPAVWDAVMDEMLRTHYVFAHVFMPVIRAQTGGGRYIGIGGGAAYHPIHNSSSYPSQPRPTHADSALRGRSTIRGRYPRTRGRRVPYERAIREHRWPEWITADDVGRVVVELVTHGKTTDPGTRTGPYCECDHTHYGDTSS